MSDAITGVIVREPLRFSAEELKLIRQQFAPTADETTFQYLMKVAAVKRLNPLLNQINFVKRGAFDNNRNWVDKWAFQITIDGFRSKADENPAYDGQSPREFTYSADGERVVSCTVAAFRKDRAHPFVATVHYSEFVQTKKDHQPTQMWATKPHVMLGKCAEAAALRMAFPDELGGVYAPEEMEGDDAQPVVAAPALAKAHAKGAEPAALTEGNPLLEKLKTAKTEAELMALVPDLSKIPDGQEKTNLRQVFASQQVALKGTK